MIHLRKLRLTFTLQRPASNFTRNHHRSSENPLGPIGLFRIAQNPRLYRTERAVQPAHCKDLEAALTAVGRTTRQARREAKAALMEYLHSTRSIQYLDADNMSRNSPYFLEELLKKVEKQENIARSVSRLMPYDIINNQSATHSGKPATKDASGFSPVLSLLPVRAVFVVGLFFFICFAF